MVSVFIDGQAGTTGLQITERLSAHGDVSLLRLDDAHRKDLNHRQDCLQAADVAILCLPDEAAQESVKLAADQTRIIDASTAYRVDPDWVYGVAELCPEQRGLIRGANKVSNPGCYPQGFILLIKPLIDANIIDPNTALRCNAVSGYSGGGRSMIEAHESYTAEQTSAFNTQLYALNLSHKHVPEMHKYSGTLTSPIFSPSVAHYYNGMLVQIPLFNFELANNSVDAVHAVLTETYAEEQFIEVLPLDANHGGYVNPTACNGTNRLELMVLGNATQTLLVARYDNLGKGAAGAAVQNLNLMLGMDEETGL